MNHLTAVDFIPLHHNSHKKFISSKMNPLFRSSTQKTHSVPWLEHPIPPRNRDHINHARFIKDIGIDMHEIPPIKIPEKTNLTEKAHIVSSSTTIPESIQNFLNDHYSNIRESAAFKFLLSGGIAGAVSRTATAPLDRIKIFLQVEKSQTSMSQSIRYIYQEGGLAGFYKGNGTNIVKIAPETGVKFFVFEKMKYLLSDDPKTLSPIQRFIAGATAGVVAQTTIYPLECVKTRLAIAAPGVYKGIWDCLYTTQQKEGLRSLYRGLSPAIVGVIPYAGIDLAVYETLKSLYLAHTEKSSTRPGVLPLFLCGLVSSTCGQLVAYPLSLIRTRLQAQGLKGHPNIYSNSFDAFQKIVAREGVRGLYKGILPNFLKVAPAVSISYVVYENVKSKLNQA